MAQVPDAASQASWFVMMPDVDAGHRVVHRLRQLTGVVQTMPHASGRPWIAGRWQPGEAVTAELGHRRLAALGDHRLRAADLRLDAPDAVRLCESLRDEPGSFHTLATTPDGTAVRGGLAGFRRVYWHTAPEGPLLVSDRADVLAALTGSDVDDEALALRLLTPFAPWPLSWRPVWRGVHGVPPHELLAVDRAGRPRTRRWWQPPEASLDLDAAAGRLHEALSAAVALRGRPGDVIAGDLSGTDSTSLCALAVRQGRRVIGLTCVSPDPLDDDLPWAELAAREFGTLTHEVIEGDANPLPYTDLHQPADSFDEPTSAVMYRAGFLAASRRAAAHGAAVRLTGFGGDELFSADPALQVTLLRTHPRLAVRHLTLLASAHRWGRGATLRAVLDRRSYRGWLTSVADELTTPASGFGGPLLSWGPPARLAAWTAPDAVATVRRILRDHAASADPLDEDRGWHGRLAGLHAGAAAGRHLAQASRRVGVTAALPYFDDRVVNASLRVRLADVTSPRQYKPLLVRAVRDVLPDPLASRSTKADTSIAALQGATRHHAALRDLAERSRLAERGLIDAGALRAALEAPDDHTYYDLDQTLACETWLRVQESRLVKGEQHR
ncbi:asparagine synthase-related protein [Micromonospora sp. NPDC051300]|uniref:asparagine synthase-related protein n=1 Tax=Micromonospora sp. NPDC051300 TaxID=3364286 RepID=UPI00379BD0A5